MRILLRACLLVETRWQSRGVSVGGHALAVKPAKASCARIAVRWRRRSSRPITKQAFAPPPPFEGGNFRQRPNISRTNLNFRPVRAKKRPPRTSQGSLHWNPFPPATTMLNTHLQPEGTETVVFFARPEHPATPSTLKPRGEGVGRERVFAQWPTVVFFARTGREDHGQRGPLTTGPCRKGRSHGYSLGHGAW